MPAPRGPGILPGASKQKLLPIPHPAQRGFWCWKRAAGVAESSRAADAVAVARDPTIRSRTQNPQARQSYQNTERPQPPHRAEQHRPCMRAADDAPVGKEQLHFRAQFGIARPGACGRAGCLQRQPPETMPREQPTPTRGTTRTHGAIAVVKDFAARRVAWGWRVHGFTKPKWELNRRVIGVGRKARERCGKTGGCLPESLKPVMFCRYVKFFVLRLASCSLASWV